LKSQAKIDTMIQITVERILTLAEDNYLDMKERGIWNTPTVARGLITCWNCNEEGHSAKKCPKPRNEKNVNDNKAKFDQAKGERTSTGRGGGRGGRGGRGRGRNSYGGRGRGGGRSGGPNTEEVKGPVDIMKTPPMRKGMTVMNIGGTTHYWCHKCSCWNVDHGTTDHPIDTQSSTTQATTKQSHTANAANANSSFRETIFQGTRGSN
jgi:Zinc knuckle